MAELLLGADGGNTKTIALVADRDGTILGAGRAGTSDLYNAVSVGAAIGAIGAAVAAALEAAGCIGSRRRGGVLQPGRRRLARGLRAPAEGAAGEDRPSRPSRWS